jgi:hypothetical protein
MEPPIDNAPYDPKDYEIWARDEHIKMLSGVLRLIADGDELEIRDYCQKYDIDLGPRDTQRHGSAWILETIAKVTIANQHHQKNKDQ